MLVLEWNEPKITLNEIESYLRNYLGENYDGVSIADSKMSILTYSVLTPEQEDVIKGWFYTVNDTPAKVKLEIPSDPEGKPLFVRSMTRSTWHYSPRSFDFYAGKLGSLYNREHYNATIDGSPDIGDAWLRFYEPGEYGLDLEMVQNQEETDEQFQARLSQKCIKTVCEFENTKPFDIIGAMLSIQREPTDRAYLWVVAAPDIPREWGGNVTFMGGGMNLQMFAAKIPHVFNADSTKTLYPDPVYHSGKVSIIVKHKAGDHFGLQMIFLYYEE